jgi:hypothetical protein
MRVCWCFWEVLGSFCAVIDGVFSWGFPVSGEGGVGLRGRVCLSSPLRWKERRMETALGVGLEWGRLETVRPGLWECSGLCREFRVAFVKGSRLVKT